MCFFIDLREREGGGIDVREKHQLFASVCT